VESRLIRRLGDRSDTEEAECVMGGGRVETGDGDGPRDIAAGVESCAIAGVVELSAIDTCPGRAGSSL